MKLQAHDFGVAAHIEQARISLRCPVCRHSGSLDSTGQDTYGAVPGTDAPDLIFGVRRCPRPECHAVVFVVYDERTSELVASFPPEVLDVDTDDLPAPVVDSLEQAVKCHAVACYGAAAIMVRRTLEDVCHDKGIDAKANPNLKARIAALGTTVVLPVDLLTGLDQLRLLGNDAAHIEAQTYHQVGKTEVEVAIDVVKVLLISVYQTKGIIERLQALQKTQATTPST